MGPSRFPLARRTGVVLLALLALTALACGAPLLVRLTPAPEAGTTPPAAPAGATALPASAVPTGAPAASDTPASRPRASALPTRAPTQTPTRAPTQTPTRVGPAATPVPAVISHPVDPGPYAAGMLPAELQGIARLDDATVYTLSVSIDWQAKTAGGHEDVLYTNNESAPLDTLYMRLYPNAEHYAEGQSDVTAVTGATSYSVDGSVLRLNLAQPLAPEAQIALGLDFLVTVPHTPDRFGWDEDTLSLGHWYPVMAVYDDEGWNLDPYVTAGDAFYSETSFYHVQVSAPADLRLATTGVEQGEPRALGGQVTHTYVAPAVRDFAIAASPAYQVATRAVHGTTVRSFYLPGDETPGTQAAEWGARAIEEYNRLFGPYPYAEFDIAETYFVIDDSPGGMEFPNLVFISTEFYAAGGMYAPYHEIVLAHEIGHQWWYGLAGDNQVDDPWLDEAFATYSSIRYMQDVEGKEAGDQALLEQAATAYLFGSDFGSIEYPVGSSLLDFHEDLLTYDAFVYGKGALFLQLLRRDLGDDTFDTLLRTHFQDNRYGVMAPDSFRRAIDDVSGDLHALALYDQWVTTDEPVFEQVSQMLGDMGLPLP